MSTWSPCRHCPPGPRAAHRASAPGALAAQRSHHGVGIPAQIRRREHPHGIGPRQRRPERLAVHTHAHGGGARLEHGDDALVAHLAAQPVDGRGDRGRVMREVVVHRDAAHFAAQLHAPLHAAELGQRGDGLRTGMPGVTRGADGGERILGVVRAQQVPAHACPRGCPASSTTNLEKSRALGLASQRPGDVRRRPHARIPRAASSAHGERRREIRVAGIPQDAAAAGTVRTR